MRIAVVGAGAMGSIFGAGFTEGGHDTVLVDVSQPLVEKLNADGVHIDRQGEKRTVAVRATAEPASVGPVDLVVFFTKCYHTAAAAEAVRPLVAGKTVVASLQNGWGNGDTLAGVFDPAQISVGVTYHSGTVAGIGDVLHTGIGPTVVGPYEGSELAVSAPLKEAVESCGFEVSATPAIRTEIWKKLVLNSATLPTSALTGLSAGALGDPEEPTIELVDALARESTAVARAQGYEIDPHERVEAIRSLLVRAGPGKASMLQDFEAGRRTEIDVINGAVARAAEAHGVDAPLNAAMVRLVKGWERARGIA
jgi:2-dehydropantoate 2-reductase